MGFEALYWLPFLERLIQDGIPRERLIPITRGGAAAWYGTPSGMEVYAMRSPQDLRVEQRQRILSETESSKQLAWTPFERQLVQDTVDTLQLTAYQTLHPRWMYHALAPYYEAQRGLDWLNRRTIWAPMTVPALPVGMTLPERFVAVRFYLRPTFQQPAAVRLAEVCVQQLAQQLPVIVLSSNFFADDHADVTLKGPNILHLSDLTSITPANNLAVQSAVLAQAVAFVGTYGGFAQLALRLGRPVVSFYDQWQGTMLTHKHLSEALASMLGVTWQVVGVKDFGLLQAAMPELQTKAA